MHHDVATWIDSSRASLSGLLHGWIAYPQGTVEGAVFIPPGYLIDTLRNFIVTGFEFWTGPTATQGDVIRLQNFASLEQGQGMLTLFDHNPVC
jgi:hypothetical protein